jgi:hypothetical protein
MELIQNKSNFNNERKKIKEKITYFIIEVGKTSKCTLGRGGKNFESLSRKYTIFS